MHVPLSPGRRQAMQALTKRTGGFKSEAFLEIRETGNSPPLSFVAAHASCMPASAIWAQYSGER